MKKNISIDSDKRWIFASNTERFFLFPKLYNNTKYSSLTILELILVLIKSSVRLIYYFYKHVFVLSTKSHINNVLFILLSAERGGYENLNMYRISSFRSTDGYVINSFHIVDYMKFYKPRLRIILKSFVKSIRDFILISRCNMPLELLVLLLKHAPENIAVYSYLKAFFSEVKINYPEVIIYSCGSTLASHASISCGIRTINIYHGLMSKITLNSYPLYDEIYVYSEFEKKYLESKGVKSDIHLYPSKKIRNHQNVIIVFLPINAPTVRKSLDNLLYLINFFNNNNYNVYLKSHPENIAWTVSKWIEILNINDTFEVKDGLHASDIIVNLSPRFVIGWTSTSLCEALNMNVIPISISDRNAEWNDQLDVYPIYDKALSWSLDNKKINDLVLSKGKYQYKEILNSLNSI